jgi:hypothetical protein
VVEYLPSNYKALNLNPLLPKRKICGLEASICGNGLASLACTLLEPSNTDLEGCIVYHFPTSRKFIEYLHVSGSSCVNKTPTHNRGYSFGGDSH